MVNARLPAASCRDLRVAVAADFRAKTAVLSVNESFSKPLEFFDSFNRIRIECAQKREQPVQARLLACVMRHNAKRRQRDGKRTRIRDRDMFFLIRVAFWLTIVLALLPFGSSKPVETGVQVAATDAVVAATAAVSDFGGFCERQPEACTVGAQAATAIGARAQAGAKMVYEFLHDHVSRIETGSVPEPGPVPVRGGPASAGSQSTLRPADLRPDWRGPQARTQNVPLPLPRPRKPGRSRA
jgi:hypothetical protein